eukprot:TRINITY_DN4485_c0_g1_i3.p1 TRINITY_DN4485_c0_g1~~TRINITY_DN4485_c0_g1_i3.p1  ORF type:complete len:732 (+),score=127.74 TRINITY_DN4485_c0_g1_i3:65-2197(+)
MNHHTELTRLQDLFDAGFIQHNTFLEKCAELGIHHQQALFRIIDDWDDLGEVMFGRIFEYLSPDCLWRVCLVSKGWGLLADFCWSLLCSEFYQVKQNVLEDFIRQTQLPPSPLGKLISIHKVVYSNRFNINQDIIYERKKLEMTQNIEIAYQNNWEIDFEGVVIRIESNNTLVVKNSYRDEFKVGFFGIITYDWKPIEIGKCLISDGTNYFGLETREFLRLNLIKKRVRVIVDDYDENDDIGYCRVYLNNMDIGLQLIYHGLANTAEYNGLGKEYHNRRMECESLAKQNERGIHTEGYQFIEHTIKYIWEPSDIIKDLQSGRHNAVVEDVKHSGVTLWLKEKDIIIYFRINYIGISEKEVLGFLHHKIFQQDVQIKIEQCDILEPFNEATTRYYDDPYKAITRSHKHEKKGHFSGKLYFKNKDIGLKLISLGKARSTLDSGIYYEKQENAKKHRRGIWANNNYTIESTVEKEGEHLLDTISPDSFEIIITKMHYPGFKYAKNDRYEKMLRSLCFTRFETVDKIELEILCCARISEDNKWIRATIIDINYNYTVVSDIDYNKNCYRVHKKWIKKLPPKFGINDYPPRPIMNGLLANLDIKKSYDLLGKIFKARVQYRSTTARSGNHSFSNGWDTVVDYLLLTDPITNKSINVKMVDEGYADVKVVPSVFNIDSLVSALNRALQRARNKRIGIWESLNKDVWIDAGVNMLAR